MTLLTNAELVKTKLTPLLIEIYNIEFKNKSEPPEFKKYRYGSMGIVIYPNAIEYTKGQVTTCIRWELINSVPSNVTYPYEKHLNEVCSLLGAHLECLND